MHLQSLHDEVRISGVENAPCPAWSRTPGVRRWVRTFAVRWTAAPAVTQHDNRAVRWRTSVIQGSDHERALALTFDSAQTADGLLVWLGTDADETSAGDLFAACRMARSENILYLAICHAGAAVAAFARSLALESVVTIERLPGVKRDDIARELMAGVDEFREVRIGRDGLRYQPCFSLESPELTADNRLADRDVVLVTGGTKGIGAECALRLGSRTGAAIVLVGRSSEHEQAVAATLARARAVGIRCSYALVDVTDPEALACAVSGAARRFGPITALVHAAGFNETRAFQDIDDAGLLRMMAPKTIGFRAAVRAAGTQLRHGNVRLDSWSHGPERRDALRPRRAMKIPQLFRLMTILAIASAIAALRLPLMLFAASRGRRRFYAAAGETLAVCIEALGPISVKSGRCSATGSICFRSPFCNRLCGCRIGPARCRLERREAPSRRDWVARCPMSLQPSRTFPSHVAASQSCAGPRPTTRRPSPSRWSAPA